MPDCEYFIDSNVILYALSSSEPGKHAIAVPIISRAIQDRSAVISTQVVQECLNVATGKLESTIPGSASTLLTNYLMPLCTVFPSESLYKRAIELKGQYQLSFYDACIVAAGLQSGAKVLLTEDLQDGQSIEGIRVQNPFS